MSQQPRPGSQSYGLTTDLAQINARDLGLQAYTCRVCGEEGDFQTWQAKEMMIPTREEFAYCVCPRCGCLQIKEVPADLSKYYQQDYYSYTPPDITPPPPGTPVLPQRLLDVGCGAGRWLCDAARAGYRNVFGCDPFIEQDLFYTNGVQIKKATIHEMEGQFDLIRFSHSFEHMDDPQEVMDSVARLLHPDGVCVISIPIYPNVAFDIYGPFWFQLDAPRHLILHSGKSLGHLAGQNDLSVFKAECNSLLNQMYISRLYQLDIPMHEQSAVGNQLIAAEEFPIMEELTQEANERGYGDQATFYLCHKGHEETAAQRLPSELSGQPAQDMPPAPGTPSASGVRRQDVADLAQSLEEVLQFLVQQREAGTLAGQAQLLDDALEGTHTLRGLIELGRWDD